jgi:hypothetical protein
VLLAAPLVWQHYLIRALPAVIVLLRSAAAPWRWLALVAYVAVAIDPYAILFGMTDPARQAPIVVAGVGCSSCWSCWRSRAGEDLPQLGPDRVEGRARLSQNHAGRQVEMYAPAPQRTKPSDV